MPTDGRRYSHWTQFIEEHKVEVPLMLEFPFLPVVGNHERTDDHVYELPNYQATFEYPQFYVLDAPDAAFFVVDSNLIIDQYQSIDDDEQDALFRKWFVSDDPDKTVTVLKSKGYSVRESSVIAVEAPDHPGGLQAVLKPLKEADVNVLYLYPYLGRGESGQPIIIVGVDKTEEALELMKKNWVHTFGDEIYAL